MVFYTGDRIPAWRGNLFVGAMLEGRIPGTGHLQRIVFNDGGEIRREALCETCAGARDVGRGRMDCCTC
jgi:glucose/arabinose dehydrogenase